MILSAHQPAYLPWLGQFHKIALADLFCFFDDVQYQPKSFDNRNRVKHATGTSWLSVPVNKAGFLDKSYLDIEIQPNNPWARKHWMTLELNYCKAPFFDRYASDIAAIYNESWPGLAELNHALLILFLRLLGIETPVVRMSDYAFEGEKSDLVQNMCTSLGADIYIFGEQGRGYADTNSFMQAGVVPYFQTYNHPVYPQQYGPFEPYLSVVDLLFNCGPESLSILLSGNITRAELEQDAELQRESFVVL
jgi:hypothetical protein